MWLTTCAFMPAADPGVSTALEATPEHDGTSHSQHQPGVQQSFDTTAHMRRMSIQQQASTKVRQLLVIQTNLTPE